MGILDYILIGVITAAITEFGYNLSKEKDKKPINWFDRFSVVLVWPIAIIILVLSILTGERKK